MADKVTAGEWVADRLGYVKVKGESSGEFIADCNLEDEDGDYRPVENIRANTRLMAASKRMYRFIRGIRGTFAEADKLIKEIDVEVD